MDTSNHHYLVVEKIITYLNENKDRHPSLEEISDHIHLSKFHLQRVFKNWVGVTPKDFLQYLTLEHSKSLLSLGKSTLETSYEVGLSGNGRLHDLFVKFESVSPGEFKNKGRGIVIRWEIIESVFGETLIAETEKGICKIAFKAGEENLFDALTNDFSEATFNKGLGDYGILLKTYLETWEIPKKKIPLHFKGTPFQIQVWKALLQVPSGQLVCYQDIGNKINNPKAVRAIGTAIGKNPIAYLIPCHRVIKNNGVSGGYRWIPERKQIINAFEASKLN
ncbi:bifunctional helix-turn-helix domain-containing protein/methylated-DNA--[protein]-cysteine S-methyltransferase [Tenacibaculum xiamenense]|uniref:bifunctional helix-turn-helix domain-containing protein/methylated-DNA--[protein]-cysteine S-methyltransferase n=1 Tax=Tenacibaculum xiamenense TaxID=1261553 RepID=UPI003896745F